MIVLLNRIAWIVSLTLAILLGFLISDLNSGGYSSGGENFFEWGWIWALIFLAIIKGKLLSQGWIESVIGGKEITSTVSQNVITQQEASNTTDSDTSNSISSSLYATPSILQNPDTIAQTENSVPFEEKKQQEPSKPNWIVVFFSDRPLAKIGGILLFLGALFFLSLVWNGVGPVGKILIGLIFGFTLYTIGVWMDKRGHVMESRTLLGVGIAINTLTILSGRWIIGDGSEKILSDTITLIFLLLNTLFAVVTGLLFVSRTFLIFSFVFAYLIPFLVGSETNSANLMILYIAIVSISGYLLAYFLEKRHQVDNALWLSRVVLIGSTILMTLSGLSLDSTSSLILHSLTFLILSSIGVFLFARVGIDRSNLPAVILSGYIMLTSALFGMGRTDGTILIYIIALVPLMFFTVTHIVAIGATMILSSLLFVPLIFGLMVFFVFGLPSLIFILLPILCIYSVTGFFILGTLSILFQYLFFIGIAVFLSVFSIVLGFNPLDISTVERIVVGSSVIILFLASLWTSIRYKLIHLSVMTLIASSILLVFILIVGSTSSWVIYFLFLCIGFVFPFVLRDRGILNSPVSTIGYLVILNLFMIGELFYLGRDMWFTGSSTSLITLGVIVFVISIVSLIYSVALVQRLVQSPVSTIGTRSLPEKNMIAGILALPLSLFSLAVAVTFSYSALIVSSVWILESSILAYFSGRTKNKYILGGAIVLLVIGLIRLFPFFETIVSQDWLALIPICIIGVSLFLGVKWIPARDTLTLGNVYDVLHIFGIIMVGYAFMEIIPHTIIGWSLLGMSIFLAISTWFYVYIESKIISLWAVFVGLGYFLYHLVRLDYLSIDFGPLLLQLFSLSVALLTTFYSMRSNPLGRISFTIGSILTLLITSLYVNQITNNVFAVTIYLTIVSTLFLLFGIQKDQPYLRTIGLYIGTIVLGKILLYDLWIGVDNLIIRVVALMVSGGVMIALSQLYGRRVNRTWSEEFSLSNFALLLSGGSSQSSMINDDMPFTDDIADDLRKVDISNLSGVEFKDTQGGIVFESRRAGIIRIVSYITITFSKTQFAPGELLAVFTKVVPHIRSTLPKKDLDTILATIEKWIQLGGSVNLVPKSSKQ